MASEMDIYKIDALVEAASVVNYNGEAPPVCRRCGHGYTFDYGDEPTPFYNECAHAVVDDFAAYAREMTARLRAWEPVVRAAIDEEGKAGDHPLDCDCQVCTAIRALPEEHRPQ